MLVKVRAYKISVKINQLASNGIKGNIFFFVPLCNIKTKADDVDIKYKVSLENTIGNH